LKKRGFPPWPKGYGEASRFQVSGFREERRTSKTRRDGPFRRQLFLAALLLVLPLTDASASPGPAGPPCQGVASRILELTGARTKIVWERGIGGRGHFGGDKADYRLMGYDTDERGEHEICPGPGSYAMPLITPDGEKVIFSDTVKNAVYVVNWDGTGKKKLLDGHWGLDVLREPDTGVVWVYAGEAAAFPKMKAVRRFRLDDPEARELVWNQTELHNRFTIAPDGLSAAGTFPWPKCGIAALPNRSWRLIGKGCCPDLSPDGSGRFFRMLGNHREIVLYDRDGENPRKLRVNTADGMNSCEVWYPYWTNHPRFLTVVGPFPQGINKHGKSNVYLGKFNESYTAVEKWAQVTSSTELETMASAWVAPSPPTAGASELRFDRYKVYDEGHGVRGYEERREECETESWLIFDGEVLEAGLKEPVPKREGARGDVVLHPYRARIKIEKVLRGTARSDEVGAEAPVVLCAPPSSGPVLDLLPEGRFRFYARREQIGTERYPKEDSVLYAVSLKALRELMNRHRLPHAQLRTELEAIIAAKSLPEVFGLTWTYATIGPRGGKLVIDSDGWKKIVFRRAKDAKVDPERTWGGRTVGQKPLTQAQLVAFVKVLHSLRMWELDESSTGESWSSSEHFEIAIGESRWYWQGSRPNRVMTDFREAVKELIPEYWGLR